MHVTLDIPEPKAHGLDVALAKQFADIQRQLMGLVKEQSASRHSMHQMLMEGMDAQREGLLKAMERLLVMVGASVKSSQPSDALAEALRGIKRVMTELPGELKDALETQYHAMTSTMMARNPSMGSSQVTVKMPTGLVNRIDHLETAVLEGLKRSRNRTFGSNY